jgi:hypothetical protein
MIIAGEWIGPGIQKGVALAQFKKRAFVILSVSINGEWLPDSPYQDIHDEANGFYNISRGGFFHDHIDLEDLEGTSKRLQIPTFEVEKECPFAKTFGITSTDEVIVWKPAHPLGSNPNFWIETKGPLHRVTDPDKLSKNNTEAATRREKIRVFAEATVTENRLEQGWRYLEEMGVKRDKKEGLREFMGGISGDILSEERNVLLELGLDVVEVKKYVGGVAVKWYLKRLSQD